MRPTLLILGFISFCWFPVHSQFQSPFDDKSYIVRWKDGTTVDKKEKFYGDFRSRVLCEMTFNNREFAWLEFLSFDNTGTTFYIDVEGGVIGAQSEPVIDGASLDHLSEHSAQLVSLNNDCLSNFDLTMPMGQYEVSLYNLDTGVSSPMCDNPMPPGGPSCCPDICVTNVIGEVQDCLDTNGHGTHGVGIQQAILNESIETFGGLCRINLKSYKVFNGNGQGNMGAILCALSDVIQENADRQVVNCSFSFIGGTSVSNFDPLELAFKDMAVENILSVVAAGNDKMEINSSFQVYPASYFSGEAGDMTLNNSILTVGGAKCDRSYGEYSNFSSRSVDVATLGTWPGPGLNSDIVYYEGTSQATFATSAISAMLMSHQPAANLAKLKCAITSSSVIDESFSNKNISSGILSASMSLLLLENTCTIQDACPPIKVVTGIVGSGDFQGAQQLISNGYIKSEMVKFTANESISLHPGFLASPSMQFEANIENCSSSITKGIKD